MSNSKFAYYAVAIVAGLLFGAGLYVSQMVDPYKVLHFLDFGAIPTGGWDPSLAFVMGGGLLVMVIAVRYARRFEKPLFDATFHGPDYDRIDGQLVAGAALFGIGWGMSGICPGPPVSLLAFLPDNLWIFLVAMFAGSFIGSFVMKARPGRVVTA